MNTCDIYEIQTLILEILVQATWHQKCNTVSYLQLI